MTQEQTPKPRIEITEADLERVDSESERLVVEFENPYGYDTMGSTLSALTRKKELSFYESRFINSSVEASVSIFVTALDEGISNPNTDAYTRAKRDFTSNAYAVIARHGGETPKLQEALTGFGKDKNATRYFLEEVAAAHLDVKDSVDRMRVEICAEGALGMLNELLTANPELANTLRGQENLTNLAASHERIQL